MIIDTSTLMVIHTVDNNYDMQIDIQCHALINPTRKDRSQNDDGTVFLVYFSDEQRPTKTKQSHLGITVGRNKRSSSSVVVV
jgi:hypothetical protein